METQKNDEKNIVLELKRQLGRMMVQVDYMYRNDREMSRLDCDIMMEHTRELYNLLCDYQAEGDNHFSTADKVGEDKPIQTEINEGGELINRDVELEIDTPEDVKNEPDINCENDGDEKDLPFDEAVDKEEVTDNNDSVDEEIDDDDSLDDEEDWEDEGDEMFRVEPAEEKPVEEDNSLAAKLKRTPINDIRAELSINDKIMIINNLFKGSLDRFNKSIDALNEFPTLSGSRIYLSELQIELQWDTESPAYQLLYDLVERRFI